MWVGVRVGVARGRGGERKGVRKKRVKTLQPGCKKAQEDYGI